MSETLHVTIAVVGAGPAGIAAATRAAEAGAEVLLIDEGVRLGGQIWRHHRRADLPRRARRALERLERSGATILQPATVLDASPRSLLIEHADHARRVEFERLIVAPGARELFLPFPGWTLPNVVGVGGAQALLKSGFSFAGQRVVVAGSGPLLLPVAAALAAGGAHLALVAEQAYPAAVRRFAIGLWKHPAKIVQAAAYRSRFLRTSYRTGVWVAAASGDERVREVTLTDGRRRWNEPCDFLCCAYGLIPNIELAQLLGCKLDGGKVAVDAEQRTSVPGIYCAGEATGIGGMDRSLVEGEIAGLAAGGRAHESQGLQHRRRRLQSFSAALASAFAPRPELHERVTAAVPVCRCEDVRWGELEPAWTPRQAKLYTRVGMGACQGRVCGPALAVLCGWGPNTVRPPLKPARVGTLALGDEGQTASS